MRQLALLRGINVGGNNKLAMATLRETFARAGAENVRTYINSGNVIFDDTRPSEHLGAILAQAIADDSGLELKVLLRDIESVRSVLAAIPETWTTNKEMRTDVIFLWDHVDSPEVVDEVPAREGVDDIKYTPGAILWRADRDKLTRSGIGRLVGTDLYQNMTMRSSNTVLKLAAMMEERAAG